MTDNVKLEELAKSLTQIISSLNDITAKTAPAPAPLAPPQPQRIRKTPDMTYQEYLTKILFDRTPVEVSSPQQSFALQEDLQLLLELSTFKSITLKSFEEIAERKSLNRSVETMRTRYNDDLSRVGEPEMRKIVSWFELEGLEGYLYFEEKEMRISRADPQEIKREEQSEKKRPRNASLDSSGKKYDRKSKEPQKLPTNCKELNNILKLYSKMVSVPIKTLLEHLDQLSGDFLLLDDFIETKDAKLLWSPEEDEILRRGGPEVELLRKYRGKGVDARRRYLGLV